MEALQAPLPTGSGQSPYQPIDSEGGEIRLVEVAPGRYSDPISLSLRTVKIEEWVTDEDEFDEDESVGDEPDEDESSWEGSGGWYAYMPSFNRKFEYEALSYAWGKAISPHKVLVDGFELSVTQSLEQGLRRLRFGGKPRILWIDALCINQRDMEERSHQVQHMAAIYRSAINVLIWLGEWPSNVACPHPENCQALWLSLLQELERGTVPDEIPNHMRDHCGDIMELPWFYRLWVIQELTLARRDPIVLIGCLSMSWSNLFEAVEEISLARGSRFPDGFGLDDALSNNSYSHISALAKIRSHSDSHRSLYWCLVASADAVSGDPRDKVYGLLGLCNSQTIVVDYSKPLRQVLAEATVISILEESAVPYLNEDAKPTGLFDRTHWTKPSWLLDFTSFAEADMSYVSDMGLHLEEREKRRGSIRVSMDYQTLFVHGRYIGTICETLNSSWSWDPDDTGFRDQTTNTQIYDFYHDILRPRDISPHTLLQLFRRKVQLDRRRDKEFISLLLGSRDEFRTKSTLHSGRIGIGFGGDDWGHVRGRDIFVTREGHVGISWHPDCRLVPKGAVLVCLFGTEVPFILAPIPGTQLHEMINVAYVPEYGDSIMEALKSKHYRATWTDFAAEGGREYAIT